MITTTPTVARQLFYICITSCQRPTLGLFRHQSAPHTHTHMQFFAAALSHRISSYLVAFSRSFQEYTFCLLMLSSVVFIVFVCRSLLALYSSSNRLSQSSNYCCGRGEWRRVSRTVEHFCESLVCVCMYICVCLYQTPNQPAHHSSFTSS